MGREESTRASDIFRLVLLFVVLCFGVLVAVDRVMSVSEHGWGWALFLLPWGWTVGYLSYLLWRRTSWARRWRAERKERAGGSA